ncbi:EAL domain-containing protein [Calothrix sp. PCC 6303]|uniref:EAL domain-containing protein n=1 Tax=Calothrix sp. PCC 6303 TaxID=1170562 RepID=UPI0002A05387|nr:EAL domain-containing protein [Calothrix sp. PCC 6303]AFZ02993.1 diguanylate phosphodiesterase [Calothrix sp. PCC 6303]
MNQFPTPQKPENQINPSAISLEITEDFSQNNLTQQKNSYLHNSLESYEPFIQQLMKDLDLVDNHSNQSKNILETIRHISNAEFVCVLSCDEHNNWHLFSKCDSTLDLDKNLSIEELVSKLIPDLALNSVFNPAYCGNYIRHQQLENISPNNIVILPVKQLPNPEVMLIFGLPNNSYFYTDIYGKIISSFYQAIQNKILEPLLIEAAIIDELKQSFGFVSSSLYERRLKLFCQRLQQMVIYFEPVLHLGRDDIFISGWEALARNPESLSSPSELFKAAELWGSNYILKLDQYFLITAVQSYRQARDQRQRRPNDIVPLSVNVYPETLIRKEYFETLNQLIQEDAIAPRNLILEISEKSELPQFENGIRLDNPLSSFKKCLVQYVQKLNIRFAIDDFGVGYASVSRLAGLNPSHVKIDREILHHEPCHVIIKFVHEMVGVNNLNPASVIVEGIDENSPVSLRLLKKLGVSYIQGHIVGKSQPEIYRLTQEKIEELKRLIV